MKKLAFIFGLFCSMYCYSDNNPISQIQQYNQKLSVEEATQIYEMETKYAKKYNVPVEVGLGISSKESRFITTATSSTKESYGIKQINYKVWKKKYGLTKQCLHDAECNIEAGYKILRYYIDLKQGNITNAIMAYRGSTRKQTNLKYVNDVLSRSTRFKA